MVKIALHFHLFQSTTYTSTNCNADHLRQNIPQENCYKKKWSKLVCIPNMVSNVKEHNTNLFEFDNATIHSTR